MNRTRTTARSFGSILNYFKQTDMITNVNKGCDPCRVQTGQPPYFVNWIENGEQQYMFFSTVSSMYKLFEELTKQSKTQKP
jgi:hypothetical protein